MGDEPSRGAQSPLLRIVRDEEPVRTYEVKNCGPVRDWAERHWYITMPLGFGIALGLCYCLARTIN